MNISIIAAMAQNRAIGLNNRMPWHLSADLKRFKQITMSAPIVMGRKTFESIGRPLPGRTNIIVSRNPNYRPSGCWVYNDLDSAIRHGCRLADEIYVIGGADLYRAVLADARTLYLTEIHQDFEGDTYFPEIDAKLWQETEREKIKNDPSVAFDYSFVKLDRISDF